MLKASLGVALRSRETPTVPSTPSTLKDTRPMPLRVIAPRPVPIHRDDLHLLAVMWKNRPAYLVLARNVTVCYALWLLGVPIGREEAQQDPYLRAHCGPEEDGASHLTSPSSPSTVAVAIRRFGDWKVREAKLSDIVFISQTIEHVSRMPSNSTEPVTGEHAIGPTTDDTMQLSAVRIAG